MLPRTWTLWGYCRALTPWGYLGPFSALYGQLLSGVRTTPLPSPHFWVGGEMLPVALQTETRWGLEGGWCRVAKVGEGRRDTKALRT